jgi:hypothetical protein
LDEGADFSKHQRHDAAAAVRVRSSRFSVLALKTPPVKVIRPRATDGSLHRCPCCSHPTLEERGANEICHVCYWQDEGQDDPVAGEVWGGANGQLSLTQARENFRQCGAYDPRIGRNAIGKAKPTTEAELDAESRRRGAEARKLKKPEPRPAMSKPAAGAGGAGEAEGPSYAEVLASLPEAPPPAPPPKPPRPPSAWTRPLSAEQLVRAGGTLVIIFLAALVIHVFTSGWLTREMLKDHGYYLWTHGQGRYERKYLEAFAHDPRFRQRFIGQPVDSLHFLFPSLYGGAPYDPERLRALNPDRSLPPRTPGSGFGAYWLDASQRGLTYCALLQEGRIVDFFFVERR